MLDEARRRHERGEDVVVAAIQPQQSEDLQALLQKLELVPMLQAPEGQTIDVEAVLRRAPQVCVVDPSLRTVTGVRFLSSTTEAQNPIFSSGLVFRKRVPAREPIVQKCCQCADRTQSEHCQT
jgi:hypothetical protein